MLLSAAIRLPAKDRPSFTVPCRDAQLAMGEAADQAFVVGGDHHRRAHLVQFLEQVHQAHADLVVDIAGRLVRQQQAGARDDGAGDGDALLLPAGEGRGQGVEVILEADPGQQLRHMALDVGFAHAGDAQRQRDIVHGGQMLDQAEILEHHADRAGAWRDSPTA